MHKAVPFCLVVLSLVACRPEPAQEAEMDAANAAEPKGPPPPDADLNASLEPIAGNGNSAEGDEGRPRFVGRWATFRNLCGSREWRVTEDELRTPEGYVCRFREVREVGDSYEIGARCRTALPEQDDVLRMSFSPAGMLIESESLITVGLFSCPD